MNMCDKNDLQLSLNGDTFKALKTDFDSILATTLGNMTMKSADEATITIKLSIALKKVNSGSCDAPKELTKPSFKHDISSVMQVKDKITGSLSGDYELVWDADEKKYVMRKMGAEQISLFDEEVAEEYDGEIVCECDDGDGENGYYLEAPDEDVRGDTEEDLEEISKLAWLGSFIGRNLGIVEYNGVYTVRTDANEVVLTSAEGMFHVDAEILEQHKDHKIKCIGFYTEATEHQSGIIQSVEFRCDDCYETIYEFPTAVEGGEDGEPYCGEIEPDFEDATMEYDDPEMDC